jgi:septum formation protein
MLVLASTSPRRRELLQEWGYTFKLVHAPVSEELPDGILPEAGVQILARRKALSGFKVWQQQSSSTQDVILGADTIVVLENRILGKPADQKDAEKMLRALSGKTHRVMTAIALAGKGADQELWVETDVEITTVSFRELHSQEILAYIATGEPMDKAAAYGIQGEAGKFAADVRGSVTNVIGLPMELLTAKLEKKGVFPKDKNFPV